MSKLIDEQDRHLAEYATIQRLLNVFLREHVASELRFEGTDLADLPVPDLGTQRFALSLGSGTLYGNLTYYSPHGYHHYGERFWYRSLGSTVLYELGGWRELASILLGELVSEPSVQAQVRKHAFIQRIDNSIERTTCYVSWHRHRRISWWEDHNSETIVPAAEQALVFGHPFHPTPKSSEGMTQHDIECYAPELGASFRLHYFALAPHLVRDSVVENLWKEDLIPDIVQQEAVSQLGPDHQHYMIFPCHPWQAAFLLKQRAVHLLNERHEMVYCGPLGRTVYPTSSVRTVYDPTHHTMYKLPLHVRITNFVRTNPPDQLQRSLDASRILQRLQDDWSYPGFHVVLERGYRSIDVPWLAEEEQSQLNENLAVLFRQHLDLSRRKRSLVLAALLESPIGKQEPALLQAIRTIDEGRISMPLLEAWLQRYLAISLVPLLRLFNDHGISLEAHVQNTLLQLDQGWPGAIYVRDMEGVSISRSCLKWQELLGTTSTVLHDDEEAWQRLQYYFITNHLSHLIHTLACYGKHDEQALWKVVRTCLAQEANQHASVYIHDLLTKPTLPAKANLISCLREHSEHPLYVPIPNLIAHEE